MIGPALPPACPSLLARKSIVKRSVAQSDQRPSLFLVERRISSDSLGSLTARAIMRAPTRDARVVRASSSRYRCLVADPIRRLGHPTLPLTPAGNRSLTPSP